MLLMILSVCSYFQLLMKFDYSIFIYFLGLIAISYIRNQLIFESTYNAQKLSDKLQKNFTNARYSCHFEQLFLLTKYRNTSDFYCCVITL